MKKNFLKNVILSLATFVLVFSSCKNEPIFASIEVEEKLKPASIVSVVEHLYLDSKDNEYVANGSIYKKGATETSWSKLSGLGEGATYREIAVSNTPAPLNADILLAIKVDSATQNFSEFRFLDIANNLWTKIDCSSIVGEPYKLLSAPENRSVHLETRELKNKKYTYRVYPINFQNVAGLPSVTIDSTSIYNASETDTLTEGDVARVLGAVQPVDSDEDSVVFLTKKALFGKDNSKIKDFSNKALSLALGKTNASGANNLYVLDDQGNIFYTLDNTTWNSKKYDFKPATNAVHSMAFLEPTSSPALPNGMLLVATNKGYREVSLSSDGTPEKAQEPGASELSTVATGSKMQYANSLGKMTCYSIFPVTRINDSDKFELRRIYVSALDSGNSCLWSYYTANDPYASVEKQKWNRD